MLMPFSLVARHHLIADPAQVSNVGALGYRADGVDQVL
jgi:hypothetical protein